MAGGRPDRLQFAGPPIRVRRRGGFLERLDRRQHARVPGAAFNCSHSYNWLASLRGRAGVAVNDNRTLLYATGGVAWADVDYAARSVTGPLGTGFSNTHTGWVAGAGIEHMLTPNLTARIEYLYYGFDSATAPAGALGGGPTSLDPTTQTVRFGLNFKF